MKTSLYRGKRQMGQGQMGSRPMAGLGRDQATAGRFGGGMRAGQSEGAWGRFANGQWQEVPPPGSAVGPDGRVCATNACAAVDTVALGQCGLCCLIKIVGFKSEEPVVAAATETICQSPPWDFLPFLVTVPSSIGEFFEISSFEIGNHDAIGGDPILAQTISEVATYHMLSIGCSTGAREVCVTYTNVDPALDAHTFYLTMFGYTLEA